MSAPHWKRYLDSWPVSEDPVTDRNTEEWDLADGIGLYIMAKILSYSFPVIGNRLKREENACKTQLENDGHFETIPSEKRSKLSTTEAKSSQVQGKEIIDQVQAFFARPGSTDKILSSLKPWGYAGIRSLTALVINDVCSREPLAPIPRGPASQRIQQSDGRPTSTDSTNAIQTISAAYADDGVIRDVRPWLLPNANYFPLVACKYFVYGRGRCHKGDDCTFLHQAPSDYVPPPGYGTEKVEAALRRVAQDRGGYKESDHYFGPADTTRNVLKRPYEDVYEGDRWRDERNRDDRRRGDYTPEDRRNDNHRDTDRSYNRSRDETDAYMRPRSPRRSATIDRLPARQVYDDRPGRRDSDIRGDERDIRRSDLELPSRNGSFPIDKGSAYDSYRPPNHGDERHRDIRGHSREISAEFENRSLRRPGDTSIPSVPPANGSAPLADPFKNAETLLEKATNAPEPNKVQQISMLDRYITLQSKMPKTENNIQIYEYLLTTIEKAPKSQQPRYLKFLHAYLALINRNTADFDPMGAMMNLAEQCTGEVQARAVPLLDRYMSLTTSIDLEGS